MKQYLKFPLLSFAFIFSLSLATVVFAQTEVSVSKQQAVNIAQQHYPGRVLAVKLKDKVYMVKTLSDEGEVRIISVDAETGKVISDK